MSQNTGDPILDVRNVDAWYGRAQALQRVSVSVQALEVVGLFGHNGAGKSTLLRVIAGLHTQCSGQVAFGGRPLDRLKPHERAKRGVVLVREGARVFDSLSVREHMLLGARLAKISGRSIRDPEAVYTMLPMLGPLRHRMAGYLSGGQRQMLCLGMALASQATCMVLDEPSTGLAPAVSEQLYASIESLARSGVTFFIAEQNPIWLGKVATRGYVMEVGRIVSEGQPADLINQWSV